MCVLLLQNSDTFFYDESELCVFLDVSSGDSWEVGAGSLSPSFIFQSLFPLLLFHILFVFLPSGPSLTPLAPLPTEGGPIHWTLCLSSHRSHALLPWAPFLDHTTDLVPLSASDIGTHMTYQHAWFLASWFHFAQRVI